MLIGKFLSDAPSERRRGRKLSRIDRNIGAAPADAKAVAACARVRPAAATNEPTRQGFHWAVSRALVTSLLQHEVCVSWRGLIGVDARCQHAESSNARTS